MPTVPAKVRERIVSELKRYQKTLDVARSRDVNEADTVTIVRDLLADLFGYDKYAEITSEYAIRGSFCDLAIKVSDKPHLLIEVKAIGLDLKVNHLRQALGYAAEAGLDWVVLTNGAIWEAYRVLFERPIGHELVFRVDLLKASPKDEPTIEGLFLMCREGIAKSALKEYHEAKKITSKQVFAAILLSDPIVQVLRRELRRIAPDLKLDTEPIRQRLQDEVIKRDCLEGDEAAYAARVLKKASGRMLRARSTEGEEEPDSPPPASGTGGPTGP